MSSNVNTIGSNLTFHYAQLAGSWFITGENRRYNRQSGVLGKLIPKKNFKFGKNSGPGAFELGARYTYSDFTDQSVSGGRFGRFTSALDWYANAHFRFEINYGHGSLEKNSIKGIPISGNSELNLNYKRLNFVSYLICINADISKSYLKWLVII